MTIIDQLFAPYAAAAAGTPSDVGLGGGQMFDLLSMAGKGGGPAPGGQAVAPGNLSGNRWEQLARQMAAKRYGWGPQEFKRIDWIIGGGGPNDVVAESSWNPNAVNPSSGAYGIPQILPSAHPGVHLQDNPQGQVRWLLNYIKQRYGTPQKAYAFKSSKGWY